MPGRLYNLLVIVGLLFAGTMAPQSSAAETRHKGFRVHPTQLLARLKPGHSLASKRVSETMGKAGSRVISRFDSIPGLLLLDSGHADLHARALLKKKQVGTVSSLSRRIAQLKESGLFLFVEPDHIRTASQLPTDTAFADGRLWGLRNTGQDGGTPGIDINSEAALDITSGSRDVIVAVIDTGVRYTHRDLESQMWRNVDEIADNGIDDDQDGYVDNIFGINAVSDSNHGDPMDDNGHGSHVAGTIGAAADNGHPHVGVAPEVSIMACKFLDADGSGKTSDEIKCIDFAIANGAHIINASYGGPAQSQAQEAAMQRAEAAGILFVAAAGNEGSDNDSVPSYPASVDLPNVISVATLDRHGNLASHSNRGVNSVDIAAPGVDIFSCWTGSDTDYKSISGSSMATPHVAGVATLIRARFPGIQIPELRNLLLGTVTPLAALDGVIATGGMLNAGAAVNAVADGELETRLSPPPGTELLTGDTLRLQLRITDLADVTDAVITTAAESADDPVFLNDGSGPDEYANDAIYTAELIVPPFTSNLSLALQITAPGKSSTELIVDYPIFQPAPNNNLSKATLINGNPLTVTGSNRRSNLEPGEPIHAGVEGGHSVWWRWVATEAGVVSVDTIGSTFDTILGVYQGAEINQLTPLAENDDYASGTTQSRVEFTAAPGDSFAIAVDGFGGASGDVVLNLRNEANAFLAGENNDFANPRILSGITTETQGDTSGADKEANEPEHADNVGGRSVWFQWAAPTNGTLRLSTAGSGFDTLLAVYRGNSVEALIELAENDDNGVAGRTSLIQMPASTGDIFRIALDGYNGDAGPYSLQLQLEGTVAQPLNDDFVNATPLVGLPAVAQGSNLGATDEPEEPEHVDNAGGRSVWWTWTATTNGYVTVDLVGSEFDTLLGIYTGTIVTNLTLIAANDDASHDTRTSRVTVPVDAGTDYRIVVDGFAGVDQLVARGDITLSIDPFDAIVAGNDDFANRQTIPSSSYTTNGTTIGATLEPDEPGKFGNSGGASLWWTFTPTNRVLVELDTQGSEFDTLLAVFTGATPESLVELTSNDDAPSGGTTLSWVSFIAEPDVPHHIVVDGYNGQSGDFQLNLHRIGVVSNVIDTDFDDPQEYPLNASINGLNGWISDGDGRAQITTNGVSGSGNAVLVGADFAQSNVPEIFVWNPVDLNPSPHHGIRFSTTLHINDSTNRLFDVFSWQFFNHDTNFLFGIIFDNRTFAVEYALDNFSLHRTEHTFQDGVPMELSVDLNLQHNVWQALLNGSPLTPVEPISFSGTNQLTLNEIAAAWQADNPAAPGDNHMIFDNYQVQLIAFQVPPTITDLPHSTNLLAGDTLNIHVAADGPGTITYEWFHNGAPLTGISGPDLIIPEVNLDDSGEYEVRVVNEYGEERSPPILVQVALPSPPPANDDFADAIEIVTLPHVSMVSNANADHEPGEPEHANQHGEGSVWWRWTANQTQPVTISTLGSSIDTLIAVYQGSSVNGLTEIVSNDDAQSRVRGSVATFQPQLGETYHIAVQGYPGSTGNIRLGIDSERMPLLGTPTMLPDGTIDLGGQIEPGITVVLEYSTDFVNWSPLGSVAADQQGISFRDTINTNGTPTFYRFFVDP